MGFLDIARIKAEWRPQTLADLDAWMDSRYSGSPVSSGIAVNEDRAMRFTAVGACVRVICAAKSCAPLEVKRRRKDGRGSDIAYDHPTYECLHYKPNDEMPSYNYIESQQMALLLSGNNYAFPGFDSRGRVNKLTPVLWTQMRPVRNADTRQIEYEYLDRGKKVSLPRDMVFHVPGMGYTGLQGLSVIRYAAECIGLGLAQERFSGKFFSNGMAIGGLLTTELGNKENRDDNRKQIEEKFSGLGNAHKVLVLQAGADYKPVSAAMPLSDAQFLETRKYQFAEICGWFGVPLYMVGQMDRATDNNAEKTGLEFYKNCMISWFRRDEQWINIRLFTAADRAAGYFAEYNPLGLLRGDGKAQADMLHAWRQDGFITENEGRAYLGMNPSANPMADEELVNGNLIPLKLAGQVKPANGGAGGDPKNA